MGIRGVSISRDDPWPRPLPASINYPSATLWGIFFGKLAPTHKKKIVMVYDMAFYHLLEIITPIQGMYDEGAVSSLV